MFKNIIFFIRINILFHFKRVKKQKKKKSKSNNIYRIDNIKI